MKIDEAFAILGVPKSASDDELKTKYKQLAKAYHPDVYKEDPNKFKSINEAYQLIQDYKTNPSKYEPPTNFGGHGFVGSINLDDLFGNFNNFQHYDDERRQSSPNPVISMKISFKDSVVGEDKEIKYKRFVKCATCNGSSYERIKNDCKNCDGFGRISSSQKGFTFNTTCTKCFGKNIKRNECKKCFAKGVIESEIAGSVHIPAGIVDNTTLRLQGAGNYQGGAMFGGDMYGDVFVQVNVDRDPYFQLIGSDTVSSLKLSLLDALAGCDREIRTIYGNKTLTIPPMSKNKDELKIKGCGVKHSNGVQRIILEVEYPENATELMEFLKQKQN